MLVLSRKKDEAIVLGQAIKITIVEIRGEKARLGIQCPKEIPVYREEVAVDLGIAPIDATRFNELANGLLDSNLTLVISRKKDESILIGGGLARVYVIEIRGDKVRLGVECPREVSVCRGEDANLLRKNQGLAFGQG